MRNPPTIIGSETEYGILVTAEDGTAYSGNTSRDQKRHEKNIASNLIERMISEGIAITGGGLCRDKDTFESVDAHNKAEQVVSPQEVGLVDSRETQEVRGYAQRRGYTGSFLVNGARFYQDMMHPEYSCPECADPYTAMCAQKAGDFIVEQSALRTGAYASEVLGQSATVHIMKNNSDGQGSSYAGHENYLVSRPLFPKLGVKTPESDLVTLFFVARQIITGAGKVGAERRPHVPYQISQRPDFFSLRFSQHTTIDRGIINLRDMSYADDGTWARFHVIIGDSNRSDLSLFLKHGMTALVFKMLETGFFEKRFPWWGTALVLPVQMLQIVSRDLTLEKKMIFDDRRRATAVEIMSAFAACAEEFVDTYMMPSVWRDVITYWKGVLEGLSGDRQRHPLSRSLDWVVMERVLKHHARKTGESIGSTACRAIELSYRTLGQDSVYDTLVARGQILTLAKDEDVKRLIHNAPTDTRAWLRSEIIRRFEKNVMHIKWDSVHLAEGPNGGIVQFLDPLWGDEVRAGVLFQDNPSFDVFLKNVKHISEGHVRVSSHSDYLEKIYARIFPDEEVKDA